MINRLVLRLAERSITYGWSAYDRKRLFYLLLPILNEMNWDGQSEVVGVDPVLDRSLLELFPGSFYNVEFEVVDGPSTEVKDVFETEQKAEQHCRSLNDELGSTEYFVRKVLK